MNDTYIKKRNEYIQQKYDYLQKIQFCEEEIEKLNKLIVNNCDHEWITERESGQYGERWTFCKKCRLDRYGGFIH